MDTLTSLFNWFAGNGKYMKLNCCMGYDTFWIAATISLDLLIALGYMIIAAHWWRNSRSLPPLPAKRALSQLRNIFVLCGICGYVFIPIKLVYPAWRLYDIALAALAFYTWTYVLQLRNLKAVYSEIGRSTQLAGQLEKSLEDSQRKSLFLNAISHDLRTPLNSLMLQVKLAEMSQGDPHGLREALGQIHTSATATVGLLDSLLEFARLDWSEGRNNISTFELNPLIEQTLQSSKQAADEKHIQLTHRCRAGFWIATDRVKVQRILANLVNNAIKFTERGSVMVDVDSAARGVEINVADTGAGIPADHLARLFDDFYQVHNTERDRSKGFGLGLAICRRLARQLGGEVTVESAVGRGSRFTAILPNVIADAPAKEAGEGSATAQAATAAE